MTFKLTFLSQTCQILKCIIHIHMSWSGFKFYEIYDFGNLPMKRIINPLKLNPLQ